MDPSIRLNILLGNFTEEAENLTPYERYAIIENVVGLIKPHLKYIPQFVEIKQLMSFDQTEYRYRRQGDLASVAWGDGFGSRGGETRVVKLADISRTTGNPVDENCLLLTQAGTLHLWHQHYRRQRVFAVRPEDEEGVDEIVERSEIRLLWEKELTELLMPRQYVTPRRTTTEARVFAEILSKIGNLLEEGVRTRKARLNNMELVCAHVRQITCGIRYRTNHSE